MWWIIVLVILFILGFIIDFYDYIRLMFSKKEVDCKTCKKELYLWRTVVYAALALNTFDYAFPDGL